MKSFFVIKRQVSESERARERLHPKKLQQFIACCFVTSAPIITPMEQQFGGQCRPYLFTALKNPQSN